MCPMGAWKWMLLLIGCLLSSIMDAAVMCPTTCVCSLNSRGSQEVKCTGELHDPIPVAQMSKDTEVISLLAPEGSTTQLTIGPIFARFPLLEELRIIGWQVPNIGTNSFWGARSLRLLDLSRNKITQVAEANFRGLLSLEELRLNDNTVDSIASAAFKFATSLKVLTLARNRLSELVPRLFIALHKLEELDLSGNPLKELPPDVFRDVRSLKILKCRDCQLTTVNPQLLRLLPELRTLDLRDNLLHFLSASEFQHLRHLRHLQFDGNQLSAIPDKTFEGLRLDSLSLARNRLAAIAPMAFSNTTTNSLDLGANRLTSLDPRSLRPLSTSLRSLRLSANPIGSRIDTLRDGLSVLHQIRHLHLATIGLRNVPPDLLPHGSPVISLNLSGNGMDHLPAPLLATTLGLQILDLRDNRMRGFDINIVRRLERLRSLRVLMLSGNPIRCDECHLLSLLTWVNTSHVTLCDNNSPCPTCSSPSSLLATPIPRLMGPGSPNLAPCNGEDFEFEGEESMGVMVGSTAPLGLAIACICTAILVLGLLVALVMRHRHAAHYYTREEQRHEAVFENPGATYDDWCTLATVEELPPPPPPFNKN